MVFASKNECFKCHTRKDGTKVGAVAPLHRCTVALLIWFLTPGLGNYVNQSWRWRKSWQDRQLCSGHWHGRKWTAAWEVFRGWKGFKSHDDVEIQSAGIESKYPKLDSPHPCVDVWHEKAMVTGYYAVDLESCVSSPSPQNHWTHRSTATMVDPAQTGDLFDGFTDLQRIWILMISHVWFCQLDRGFLWISLNSRLRNMIHCRHLLLN